MNYSIIIPTLNEADNIQSCLLNLQTFRNTCEIIVVDGGSADDTSHLANPLADKVIFSNAGRAKQMNAGAKQATGTMLIFLHADTSLPANALALIKPDNKNCTNYWQQCDQSGVINYVIVNATYRVDNKYQAKASHAPV